MNVKDGVDETDPEDYTSDAPKLARPAATPPTRAENTSDRRVTRRAVPIHMRNSCY